MLNEIIMFVPLLASVTLVYILLQVLSWFDIASTTFRKMGISNIDYWFHFNVPKTVANILLPPTIMLVVVNVLTIESQHYPRGMVEMILSLYFVICVSLVEIGVIIMTSPHIDAEFVLESGLALKIWNEIVEIPKLVVWMVRLGWTDSLQLIDDIATYHRSPLSSSTSPSSSVVVKNFVASGDASITSPQVASVVNKVVSVMQSTAIIKPKVEMAKRNVESQIPSRTTCEVATAKVGYGSPKSAQLAHKSVEMTKTAQSTKVGEQQITDSRSAPQKVAVSAPKVVVSSPSSIALPPTSIVMKKRVVSQIRKSSPQKPTIVPKASENVSAQVRVSEKTTPIESAVVQVRKGTETNVSILSSAVTLSAPSPSCNAVQSNVVAAPPSPPSSSSSKAAQANVVASPPSPSSSPESSPSCTSPTQKSVSNQKKVKEQKKSKKVISYAPTVQEYHEVDATSDVPRTSSGKKRAMSYTSEGHRIVFKHSIEERIAIRKQQTEINRQIVQDLLAENDYLQNLKGPIPDSEIERDLHRDRMVCENDIGVDYRIARALGLVEHVIAKRVVSEDESFRPIGRVTPIDKKSCLKKSSTSSTSTPCVSETSTVMKPKKTVGFVEEEPEESIVPIQDSSRRPYGRDDHCYYRMHPTWKKY